MDLIQNLANAIATQEGFFDSASTIPELLNNPGDIWDGTDEQKPNRIWPHIPISPNGFLHFASVAEGTAFLMDQLTRKIAAGDTLEQLLTAWAPPDKNDTATYIANVARWAQIPDTKAPLWNYLFLERCI